MSTNPLQSQVDGAKVSLTINGKPYQVYPSTNSSSEFQAMFPSTTNFIKKPADKTALDEVKEVVDFLKEANTISSNLVTALKSAKSPPDIKNIEEALKGDFNNELQHNITLPKLAEHLKDYHKEKYTSNQKLQLKKQLDDLNKSAKELMQISKTLSEQVQQHQSLDDKITELLGVDALKNPAKAFAQFCLKQGITKDEWSDTENLFPKSFDKSDLEWVLDGYSGLQTPA